MEKVALQLYFTMQKNNLYLISSVNVMKCILTSLIFIHANRSYQKLIFFNIPYNHKLTLHIFSIILPSPSLSSLIKIQWPTYFRDKVSLLAYTGLELTVQHKLALNSWLFCIYLPGTGITDVHHHGAQLKA